MDIIQQCLSLAPVPYLTPAFSVFRFIYSSVEQAQASKQQLQALSRTIAQLLSTLNKEYLTGRLCQAKTSTPIVDLIRLLNEISTFVQKEASRPFLTLLFTKGQRIGQIDQYHKRISTAVASFQISVLVNIHAWQARNDHARGADQRELNERLIHLEANQRLLVQTLNAHQKDTMAMMISLQRRLRLVTDEDRERQFFSHALQYLTMSSGHQVAFEDWTITSYEVEFGQEIGSGGFGIVYKGIWKKTPVALKLLITEDGATPSSESIHNEIKIWSKIRHPNILQFLGANIMDDKPFIVTPYLRNGNARAYLRDHPDSDRLQILHGISLGLVYLHSHQIVHGDLKALNVLIDASANAVLCDLGLSRVKADVTSRTVRPNGGSIVGSRNWMAPERLLGGSLKKPCDIYAFGMTLHEIYTNEIPLSELKFPEFMELVVRQDVRPERPNGENSSQLSDSIWELAVACWAKDPKQRPTASTVCDILSYLLDTPSVARPMSDASPLPLTSPSNLIIRHASQVWCAAFSPDGNLIVSGSADHTIWVWNAQTGNPVLGPLQMHTDSVDSVAFSPNGRRIASGSNDNTLLIWHAITSEVVAGPFAGHNNFIWSVCFSPDGKRIASGSKDQTIRIWDAQTGGCLVGPLRGHTDGITSIMFSGNGTQIVSCSHDKTVRVWDASSGELVWGPLTGHEHSVVYVGFSPNAKRIISTSWEGNVCVWRAETGALLSGPSLWHAKGAITVAFASNSTRYTVSPDGRWIAAYADNKCTKVHVWASTTGQLTTSLDVHTDIVTSMAFSPDSRRILTSSNDKTIHVQNLSY